MFDIIKQTTDEWVECYEKLENQTGITWYFIGRSAMPDGVDISDTRVKAIMDKARLQLRDYRVGDRVEVMLHTRANGVTDTGSGWCAEWKPGVITKINRTTVVVKTDDYYYRWDHKVSFDRIRPIA